MIKWRIVFAEYSITMTSPVGTSWTLLEVCLLIFPIFYFQIVFALSMLFVCTSCLSYPQRPDYRYPEKEYSGAKIVKHENNLGFTNYNFS